MPPFSDVSPVARQTHYSANFLRASNLVIIASDLCSFFFSFIFVIRSFFAVASNGVAADFVTHHIAAAAYFRRTRRLSPHVVFFQHISTQTIVSPLSRRLIWDVDRGRIFANAKLLHTLVFLRFLKRLLCNRCVFRVAF